MKIRKKEWLIAFIISILVIFAGLIPVLYGYLQTPEGYQFAGIGRDDEYGLFTWAKQAQQGGWLFNNPYAVESVKEQLFNPLFLLIGRVSLLLGNNLVLTFNLARALSALCFLLAAYYFFSFFFSDFWSRMTAFLILCFSSGLGWLLFFTEGKGSPYLANAVSSTEALSFPSIVFYPHFTAALTLLIIGFVSYLKFVRLGRKRDLILALLSGNLLILTHPHETLVLFLAPGAYLFFVNRIWKKEWWRTILYWFSISPAAGYIGLLSQLDPVYKQFTQVPLAKLSWMDFLAIYGLLIPLAVWGVWKLLQMKQNARRKRYFFLVAWLGTVLTLLMVPFNFQRKMVMGFHLPLTVMVTLAVRTWRRSLRSRVLASFMVFILLVVLIPQNIYYLKSVLDEMRELKKTYYFSDSFLLAQAWLEENLQNDEVVLANPAVGLITPALSGKRVFIGHWGNTSLSSEKAVELWDFFDPQSGEEERLEFISEYGLDYYYRDLEGVNYNRWVFPVERQYGQSIQVWEGQFVPDEHDYLEIIFENEAAEIYRIKY